MYIPKPVNTDDVEINEDIIELSELLARNTHEVWSQGRLQDGWTYGAVRDDDNKHHPGLVEYDKLSESEKEYDRRTAMETIKLILKLGYKIVKDR